jgi:hypothetical protein
MILKKNDHFTRFYILMKAGILKEADYIRLKSQAPRVALPKNIMSYTLDEYFGLLNAAKNGDISIVSYIFAKQDKNFLKRLTVWKYFGILREVEEQFALIKRNFDAIPKPPMSQEAIQAGFDKLDFGDFGLLDYIAKRQHLTDEEAGKSILGFVIMKLQNDGKIAVCEWRMNELLKKKYK